jgi:hypothetical protein
MNLEQWLIAAVQITNGYTSEASDVLAEAPWRLRSDPYSRSSTAQVSASLSCQVTVVDLAGQQRGAFAGDFTGKTLDITFHDLQRSLPGSPIVAILILDYDEAIDAVVDRLEWWILSAVVDFHTYCGRMSAEHKQALVSHFQRTQRCIEMSDTPERSDASPPPFYIVVEQVSRGFLWDRYRLSLLDRHYHVVRSVAKRCSITRLEAGIRSTFPESKMEVIVTSTVDVLLIEPQVLLALQCLARTYAYHQRRIPGQQQALLKAQIDYAVRAVTDTANIG